MWRSLCLIPVFFMLSSATNPMSGMDVNEAGRVMAELNDWRTLMFVMLFVIVALLCAVLWAFNKLAKAIEIVATVREAINSLSQAAQVAATDAASNRNNLQAVVATLTRMESEISQMHADMPKKR